MAKSPESIRTELITDYEKLIPTLDLSEGSVERDVFIEAPLAGVIAPAWLQLNMLETYFNIHSDPESVPETFMDQFVQDNYSISRVTATSSRGVATFYSESFSETINIPQGIRIQTLGASPIVYVTTTSRTFSVVDAIVYLNPFTKRYEFQVTVVAANAGPGYGVGANTLTSILDNIQGISGVVNTYAISDGNPGETNTQYITRAYRTYVGRTIDTTAGLDAFVGSFTSSYKILKFGDSEFVRSNYPSSIDVYFPIETEETVTQDFTIPVANFTGSFTFNSQPVMNITSVVGDVSGALAETGYSLLRDTGILSYSTRSADGIKFLSPGISDTKVTVTYTYNSYLSTFQTQISQPSNNKHGRDILARRANKVIINVVFDAKLEQGADQTTVELSVESALRTQIDGGELGELQEKITLYGVAKVAGITAVDYSSFTLIPSGGGIVNTQGDVELTQKDYPEFGTLTLTPI
jgi:hypothetical protein